MDKQEIRAKSESEGAIPGVPCDDDFLLAVREGDLGAVGDVHAGRGVIARVR